MHLQVFEESATNRSHKSGSLQQKQTTWEPGGPAPSKWNFNGNLWKINSFKMYVFVFYCSYLVMWVKLQHWQKEDDEEEGGGLETRRGQVHVFVSPGSQWWMKSSTARWSKRLGHEAGPLADEQQGFEVLRRCAAPISKFLYVNIQSSSCTASFVTLLSSKPAGKSAKCASISSIKAWGLEWIQQINNNL